jgi:hypothetical protein
MAFQSRSRNPTISAFSGRRGILAGFKDWSRLTAGEKLSWLIRPVSKNWSQ